VLLYGSAYWREILNFDALARHGMIDRADLALFDFVDEPRAALSLLQKRLPSGPADATPGFAHSRTHASEGA
ncbi:MAG TPA: hypothetical protein VKT19_02540, partial [Steroidobacteraceae bacterium]|nr:hypothetical protein [Steroidobacteraceae bacterium]